MDRVEIEDGLAEHVPGEPLLSLGLLAGLLPVARGELEDAVLGPVREEAQQTRVNGDVG